MGYRERGMAERQGRERGFRPAKLVEFLEAAYDFESDDQSWLAAVMSAAHAVWGRPGPMHGTIYDASDVRAFRLLNLHVQGFTDEGMVFIADGPNQVTATLVARTFRSLLASTSEVALPEMRRMHEGLSALGWVDALYLNGLDPSGIGTLIAIWRSSRGPLPVEEMATYRRMAHHLGAAHRCRRRLRQAQLGSRRSLDATDGAEAVLDARCRVLHATGPARRKGAQAAIIETLRARDQARLVRRGTGDRLASWRPMTAVRWTLVDSFEQSGARYIVARENLSDVNRLEALSDRERQVVAYAALGQSIKETAYALGISDSTARVLLSRAGAKLGANTRARLLAHPEVQKLKPGGGEAR
jgi:DNA-binding CsgD family transcriptional regulator